MARNSVLLHPKQLVLLRSEDSSKFLPKSLYLAKSFPRSTSFL